MVPRTSTSFSAFSFSLIHSLMKVHINGNAKYFAPHLFFNLVDVVFLLKLFLTLPKRAALHPTI